MICIEHLTIIISLLLANWRESERILWANVYIHANK